MSTPRILTIMGSGETAPTMVSTHRGLVARLQKPVTATVIDTPYGFQANADELATMVKLVKEAMKTGTLGFSTARSPSHRAAGGRPVAARVAEWSEIELMVLASSPSSARR